MEYLWFARVATVLKTCLKTKRGEELEALLKVPCAPK